MDTYEYVYTFINGQLVWLRCTDTMFANSGKMMTDTKSDRSNLIWFNKAYQTINQGVPPLAVSVSRQFLRALRATTMSPAPRRATMAPLQYRWSQWCINPGNCAMMTSPLGVRPSKSPYLQKKPQADARLPRSTCSSFWIWPVTASVVWSSIIRLQTEHSTPNMTHTTVTHTPVSRPKPNSEAHRGFAFWFVVPPHS